MTKEKKQYAIGPIHWLVDKLHVSTSEYAILRDFAKRTRTWPRKQRKMAINDAIARHKDNIELYIDVINGRV